MHPQLTVRRTKQLERDLARRDSTFVADQSPAVVFVACLHDVAPSPFRCKKGCEGSEGNNVSPRLSREQSRFSWLVVSSFEGITLYSAELA